MDDELIGKKLREVNYNDIMQRGLSIFKDEKEVAYGSIGDVLKQISHLADEVIKSTNIYFDVFVIRV